MVREHVNDKPVEEKAPEKAESKTANQELKDNVIAAIDKVLEDAGVTNPKKKRRMCSAYYSWITPQIK